MSAPPGTAAPTGRNKPAKGKERSDAALGHASQNTLSPEPERSGDRPPTGGPAGVTEGNQRAKEGGELPRGWKWKTIPDLVTEEGVFIDGDWVESKDQDPDGDVRLIQLADVGDGVYRDKSDRFMTKAKADALRCTFLKNGDVLIARMPDPLGRACIFPGDEKPSVTVVDVAIVRSGNGEFDHRWLACFVNAHPFRSAISGLQAGSTRKRISRGNLATIPLPVPPLPEQRRIVAEIEKQFTRLEAGVAALRRVQANLKRYRAAVLKAACEGRLVPTEAEKWTTTTIAESVQIIDYRGRTPPFSEAGIPHLRSQNIRHGRIVWADLAFVTAENYDAFMTRGIPQEGDLLFTTEAPMGEVALAPKEKFSVAQRIMILRTVPGFLNSRFLMIQLRSPEFQSRLRKSGTGSTVTGVSSRNFQPMTLLVPPLAEQTRIVAEVERRLSVVEELESVVTANLQRATRLRQSILQKAFTGELA